MAIDLQKKVQSLSKKKETNFLIVMLAIPVLNWIVFWLIVNLTSFKIAFQDSVGRFSFVQFELFWTSLTSDGGELAVSVINTLKYFAVNTFVVLPLTILVCYFLYKKIAGEKVFRIIFFLPAIISPVVFTGVFKNVIANQGPLGIILQQIGANIPEQGFLGTVETATDTIIAYTVWTGIAGNMLIISGAMARVPVEVLESAKLDGANVWKELVNMILPLVWPTISTLLVLNMAGLLTASGPILLLQPLPTMKTWTVSHWIFDKTFANGSVGAGQYSLVSATGLCFTLVLAPLVLLFKRLMDSVPSVEY